MSTLTVLAVPFGFPFCEKDRMRSDDRGTIAFLHKIEDGIRLDNGVYEKTLKGNWTDNNFKSRV